MLTETSTGSVKATGLQSQEAPGTAWHGPASPCAATMPAVDGVLGDQALQGGEGPCDLNFV